MDREESALKFKIRSLIPELSRSEAAVAEYILNNSDDVINLSVSALADLCGVSEPTVIRACRTIGFSGYQALKIALIKSAKNVIEFNGEEVTAEDDMRRSVQKVFGAANDAINLTRDSLDIAAMEKAAELLRTTDLSISEISSAVGFVTQSKFTQAFKETYGVLPSKYREHES